MLVDVAPIGVIAGIIEATGDGMSSFQVARRTAAVGWDARYMALNGLPTT
jgi:hypothetical protein